MRVINPAIGRRLAAIRRHRMSFLAELADAIGVTKGTITHYEQGRAEIKLSRLEQIAVALRCRVDDLLAPENALPPRVTRRQRRAPTPRGCVALDASTRPRPSRSVNTRSGCCATKALYSLRAMASRRFTTELGVWEMVVLAFGVLGDGVGGRYG